MENEKSKRFQFFGRDLSEIPCFRNSFLYGINTGIGVGLLCFMFTSRVKMSTHVGFTAFCCTTLSYWAYCRYHYEINLKNIEELKEHMQRKIIEEGTVKDEFPLHNVSDVQNKT